MPVSEPRRAHNTSIFLAVFGSFLLLPGLGIFIFRALPERNCRLSGARLYNAEYETETRLGDKLGRQQAGQPAQQAGETVGLTTGRCSLAVEP